MVTEFVLRFKHLTPYSLRRAFRKYLEINHAPFRKSLQKIQEKSVLALNLSPSIANSSYLSSLSDIEKSVLSSIEHLTMTSRERLSSIAISVNYLNKNGILGDFVECGVWAGGSSAAASLLSDISGYQRTSWLYDTFNGMPAPTIEDGNSAQVAYDVNSKFSGSWLKVSASEVYENLKNVGVITNRVKLIEGKVEETLQVSTNIPNEISLLRIDTDWYASTKVILENLYPRVVLGGVVILDDYGHWRGCKAATDEYFECIGFMPLLYPIDYTGRVMVKVQALPSRLK